MTADMQDLKALIAIAADGESLSVEQAETAFGVMMNGDATPAQMGGFLMALRVRGETVEEITGAARTMRSKALTIKSPEGAVDTVGTGGDGSKTWNISSAAAVVVAGAGVPVAKHGNRALSSKSGAADVLMALGVNVDADMALVERALFDANITFLMAPRHHAATRHVMPARVELGTRTVFNLLGPLTNPAMVKRQLVGVFGGDWVEPVARVLGNLGSEAAWVVHGSDGLDEITTTGPTKVAELRNGEVHMFEVHPSDVGLPVAQPEALKGGDAETNAAAFRNLMDGEKGAYRDIVLLNSAATLCAAGVADGLKQGVEMATDSIDSGKTKAALEKWIAITNGPAPASDGG